MYLRSIITQTILSLQCRYLKIWLKIICSWRLTLWRYILGISVLSCTNQNTCNSTRFKRSSFVQNIPDCGFKNAWFLRLYIKPFFNNILFSEKPKKPLRWYWSGTNFLYDLRCVKKYCFWTENEYFYFRQILILNSRYTVDYTAVEKTD